MLPNKHELDIMSEKLRKSVVATLNLNKTEKVFVGNEEKMFLYALFLHMPNSTHKTTTKIKNYKKLTFYRMMDISNGEIAKRAEVKKNRAFLERMRYLVITIRALLIKIKNVISLKYRLQHSSNLIHYAGYLRYGGFVVPNLTDFYFNPKEEKDKKLREAFFKNLVNYDLDLIIVKYLAYLFPTSHLESYAKFKAHNISNIKNINTVVTSAAGIMDDPLLSFLIKNNNCELIYVQHGGGYGLNKNHQLHQIEDSGADLMYYWGTGDNNVYPTRYRDKYFSKINCQVFIVLSDKEDEITIKPYTNMAKAVTSKIQDSCVVVAHPNGPKFDDKNIQYGIGYRQHEKAQLVIYDRIGNSLFYTRILTKRPFFIVDSYVLYPQSDNAIKLIALLREAGILIPFNEVEQNINYWMQFSPNKAEREFEKKARLIYNHILNQPKIQDIYGV